MSPKSHYFFLDVSYLAVKNNAIRADAKIKGAPNWDRFKKLKISDIPNDEKKLILL